MSVVAKKLYIAKPELGHKQPEFGHRHFDKRKPGADPTSSARFTTHEVNTFNHWWVAEIKIAVCDDEIWFTIFREARKSLLLTYSNQVKHIWGLSLKITAKPYVPILIFTCFECFFINENQKS